MSQIVLKAENISKQYRLGQVGTGTMTHDLNRWWHKVRGKEDPYLKVGDVNDRSRAGGSEYVWSLKDINFEVKEGEVLGIIGKNGAGKSTLLKILSQVTSPTTGQVNVRGRIAALLEVGTGFHPDLSGRENVFLNGAILGMRKAEIKSKLEEIVDFSGVAKYLDTPVKRYSSGMMVRLGFAIAAHLEPEILIVDEVLAVGDAEFQKKCMGKMKDVSGQGRTILFVSHNMGAIRNLCSRAILLKNGIAISNGTVENVLKEYLIDVSNNKNVYTQESNKNKAVNLRKIALLNNEGYPITNHNFENNIIIEIDYEVNYPVDNTIVWFSIRTLDEQEIFASTDNDLNPQLLGLRESGTYTTAVKIPSKLLNTGNYRLVVGLNKISGSTDIFDRVDDIIFSIEDLSIYHSKEISTRSGLIKPFLNWTTNKNN